MGISTDEIIAVVNIDHVTIFRMIVRIDYNATCCGYDWRPYLSNKINSFMECTFP